MSPTRPRDIGTAAETAVVRYLRTAGHPHAERRALRGTADAGDVAGTPGVCWSIKAGGYAQHPSDQQIETWIAELRTQMGHAGADHGVLVLRRAGVGPASAGRWWAYVSTDTVAELAGGELEGDAIWVRTHLSVAAEILRAAGYGSVDVPDCPAGGAADRRRPPRRDTP
jgi:hypothetical protein